MTLAHKDGKGDYAAEVSSRAASGAADLLVLGCVDQGGREIIGTALDLGTFDRFIPHDGMIGETLIDEFGDALAGSFGLLPASESAAAETFEGRAADAGITGTGPFRGESYEAGRVLALAKQSAGGTDRDDLAAHVDRAAKLPGTKIGAGELAGRLRILSAGGDIDYVGVSNVEFDAVGDASGTYREVEIRDLTFETLKVW